AIEVYGYQTLIQVVEYQMHVPLILADCGGPRFHDLFQTDDVVEKLSGDVACRYGFQDDEGRVHEDYPPPRVVVEHAARQQPPDNQVVQRNGQCRRQVHHWIGEHAEHGEKSEKVEMHLD